MVTEVRTNKNGSEVISACLTIEEICGPKVLLVDFHQWNEEICSVTNKTPQLE